MARACPLAATLLGPAARAEMSAEELAKLAQNPVGNLISVPIQYNGNLNFGPEKGTQSILNIQPVIPISVNNDWNIITRTILPVVWLPSLGPGDPASAASATCRSARSFRPPTPANGSGASGRSRRRPRTATASSATTTGASARRSSCCTSIKGESVGVRRARQQRVVAGIEQRRAVVQQRPHPAIPQLQPAEGAYLTTSPILTVNWKAEGSQRWTCRSAAASARSSTSASCR